MNWTLFATVFSSVFLAELGDKTQLATILFSARSPGGRWSVLLGACCALIATSALGVLAGAWVARYVDPRVLTRIAGVGFVVLGLWMLIASSRE